MIRNMQNIDNGSPEFDQYAQTYEQLLEDPVRSLFAHDPLHFHRRKWTLIESLLKDAGVNSTTLKWLDVGCGQGELLQLAGGNFAQAMGCDPSVKMLSQNRSVEMREQCSPTVLPFGDNSVDFVTAVCVFHHVHGAARALLANEIRRVLTPGGFCCIIEHNPWNPATRSIVKRCPVDIDAELLTAHRTRILLRDAGFDSFNTNYFLYLPERLWNKVGSIENIFRKLPLGGQYALLAQASSRSKTI